MDQPIEYAYFVYAELLLEGNVSPSSVSGALMSFYSGIVTRSEPITTQNNYEELLQGLAEHFGVADTKRVVVKSLTPLFCK